MTDTVGKISFAPVDPLSDPNSFKGGHLSQTSLDLLDIVERQTKALRNFTRWYETNERDWSSEYRDSVEFMDLRELYDAARDALKVRP